uniref:F-box domain-containing protein n=1 Tax=Mesocestoides corti TaxID=53468 RepID=A0A5K3FJH8_MESCO
MCQRAKFFEWVQLYVKEVIECSSQYGADGRTAFVAENISGPPTIYPNFEDSTRSCAFLNFGTRWESYPGSLEPIRGGPSTFTSTDYIDVFFERPLIIFAMRIFETFFPGAVVAIRACYRDQPIDRPVNARGMYWATLWQAADAGIPSNFRAIDGGNSLLPASSVNPVQLGRARIFEPVLSHIPLVPTDLVRIELDIRRCAYYTQLDAILVNGYAPISDEAAEIFRKMQSEMYAEGHSFEPRDPNMSYGEIKGSPLSSGYSSCNDIPLTNCLPPPTNELDLDGIDDNLSDVAHANGSSMEVDYIQNSMLCPLSMALCKFPTYLAPMALMNQTTLSTFGNHFSHPSCLLLRLPPEVLLQIFSYFDLQTLCRISSVCRTFYYLVDESLARLKSINLQALWATTTDASLLSLSTRLSRKSFMSQSCKKPRDRSLQAESTCVQYPSWSSIAVKGVTQWATLIAGGVPPGGKFRSFLLDKNGTRSPEVYPRLKRFDFSWCGNYQSVSTFGFCRFLAEAGRCLTTLRLSSCQMVNDECLLELINICGLLRGTSLKAFNLLLH